MDQEKDNAPQADSDENPQGSADAQQKDPNGPSMTMDEEEAMAAKLRELGYIE